MSTPSHASAHWSPRAVVTFSSLSTPLVPYPSSPTHLLLLSAAPHPTSGTTIYFSLSRLPPHLFSSLRRLLNIPRPISSPPGLLPPPSLSPPPSPPVSLPTFPLLWRTRQRASGSSTQAISASGRLAAGRTWSLSGGHNCKRRRRVLCICRWLVYALHTQTPENFKLCAAIKRNVRTCQCTRGRACGSAA